MTQLCALHSTTLLSMQSFLWGKIYSQAYTTTYLYMHIALVSSVTLSPCQRPSPTWASNCAEMQWCLAQLSTRCMAEQGAIVLQMETHSDQQKTMREWKHVQRSWQKPTDRDSPTQCQRALAWNAQGRSICFQAVNTWHLNVRKPIQRILQVQSYGKKRKKGKASAVPPQIAQNSNSWLLPYRVMSLAQQSLTESSNCGSTQYCISSSPQEPSFNLR